MTVASSHHIRASAPIAARTCHPSSSSKFFRAAYRSLAQQRPALRAPARNILYQYYQLGVQRELVPAKRTDAGSRGTSVPASASASPATAHETDASSASARKDSKSAISSAEGVSLSIGDLAPEGICN
ncbi:uncharacterized protein K452DRAFT_30915 [Aplosporella prunicola CBS 121167]|uniref:Uncharacterized protein n=1 Tax=Aplosporella prunicola CBS 121167 TaxID=1176127 RepID=A0A6A6BDE0_9PEZI|nr:uncharacterized protein K452DRAFT_30915 [Aplosporella prunicola CBS 121167]KAF2141608.1 hypothetical protein K452DRAFT_30915 [Aplosporella prunicola CBS 121167]